MAAKKKRKGRGGTVNSAAIAARELDKGNFRTALKHARVLYRKDPSAANQVLLQRTLFSRAEELHRRAMLGPAREVLRELNGLPTLADATADAELTSELLSAERIQRLNALLGVGDTAANQHLLAGDPKLQAAVADQTVAQGPTPTCPADVAAAAKKVRQALDAVASGNDAQATALLTGIERSSPLADWKLFIRGLIAFYEGDQPRRDANWSRLDADRAPRRIAEVLTVASGNSEPGTDRARFVTARLALESPLKSGLRALRDAPAEGSAWRRHFNELKQAAGPSHPEVVQRATLVLQTRFLSAVDADELTRLSEVAPPCPLDPHHHRAWAVLHELDGELDRALTAWQRYVDSAEDIVALPESQRQTVRALVYVHMGELCVNESDYIQTVRAQFPWFDDSHADPMTWVEEYCGRADRYFTAARQHDANLPAAYLDHARMLAEHGEHRRASSLYKEYARQFTDSLEAMLDVADYFCDEVSNPGVAKSYIRKAAALRPRDNRVLDRLWETSFECARIAARQAQFGIARTELNEALSCAGEGRRLYELESMLAAVEFKANNSEQAQRHQQLALDAASSAPPAMLAVAANAFRCGVNVKLRKQLNDQLKITMNSESDTGTAGELSRWMLGVLAGRSTYHGFKAHAKLVEKYLGRCETKQWESSDLVDACRLANSAATRSRLLKKLAQRGVELFSNNPYFSFFLAEYEMSREPGRWNRWRAETNYQRALDLHESGGLALDEMVLKRISQGMRQLHAPHLCDEGDNDERSDFAIADELRAIIDELGISVEDLIQAMIQGDSPEQFLKRHAKCADRPFGSGRGRTVNRD